jgi:hypothetical protein
VNGFRVAPSAFAQLDVVAVGDASTSAYVAWSEDQGTGTGRDVYLMRLEGGAPAAGWPAGGLAVGAAHGNQVRPRLALSTFPVQALVTWEDSRAGTSDLYMMPVSAGGTFLPGWPANGRALVTNAGADRNEGVVPLVDDSGTNFGYGILWSNAGRILVQVIEPDYDFLPDPAWPATGRAISDPAHVASAPQAWALLSPEGSSRWLIAWLEDRDGVPQLRAQGVTAIGSPGGTLFAPAAIAAVPDPLARPSQFSRRPTPYSYYQTKLVWRDQRADAGDLYVQTLNLPVPLQPGSFQPVGSPEPLVVFSGTQGPVVGASWSEFWVDDRSGVPQVYGLFESAVMHAGEPMGPANAAQSQPSSSDPPPVPIVDAAGHAIVAWTDMRNPATAPDIYAQALGPGGPATVDVPRTAPGGTSLSLARPTPAHGSVAFTLELARASDVRFDIVDLTGRRLRALESGRLPAGELEIRWDGRDAAGSRAGPGLYWLCGSVDGAPIARRIVRISP